MCATEFKGMTTTESKVELRAFQKLLEDYCIPNITASPIHALQQ